MTGAGLVPGLCFTTHILESAILVAPFFRAHTVAVHHCDDFCTAPLIESR